jgi:hypothetical protein
MQWYDISLIELSLSYCTDRNCLLEMKRHELTISCTWESLSRNSHRNISLFLCQMLSNYQWIHRSRCNLKEAEIFSTYSQSQSHTVTDRQSVSKSWCRAPSGAHDQIFITIWQLQSCFCGTSSLTGGRVCLLYVLLALASAVILRSESFRTRDHILLSQISLFVASYDSQGHGGNIRPRLHTGYSAYKKGMFFPILKKEVLGRINLCTFLDTTLAA